MYRQIHHVTTPAAVSEFLLLDRNFPVGWEDCNDPEAGPWPLSEPAPEHQPNCLKHAERFMLD